MILGRIRQFVERVAPLPLCETCLAERLDDVAPEEVHLSLSELAVERGFDRLRAICGLCGSESLAVQKVK